MVTQRRSPLEERHLSTVVGARTEGGESFRVAETCGL